MDVKFPPPPDVLGVRPGAMAATGRYVQHQRRELLLEKKKVGSARLLDWNEPGNIMLTRSRWRPGKTCRRSCSRSSYPQRHLEKLAVAPGGTTVKVQFGLSPADEYGIPPEVDFRTSLAIGIPLNVRKGESCVA